jgi:hypothetical protein
VLSTAVDLKFYKEEVRDWLNDPLATNLKSVSRWIGKPVPIPDSELTGEYKLFKNEKNKKNYRVFKFSSYQK